MAVQTKAERAAYQQEWRQNNPERVLWLAAKHRSKRSGRVFTITADDIEIPLVCPVLGIKLTQGGMRDSSPSLDRIDSNKGYEADNIWVISWRANGIKGNGTIHEHIAIAAAMIQKEKEILL